MKWWYEPQKELFKWDCLEDVAFAITSTSRFKIESHRIRNYYIYNDNGLFDIIKGSEIDPFNIYAHNWTEEQQQLLLNLNIREKSSCEDEFYFLQAIILRQYERNICDLNLIKGYEKIINEGIKNDCE